jgi:hypothetical protein
MLKVVIVVQQINIELSEAASEKYNKMIITKIVLNKTKQLLGFIGCSKS